MDPLARALADGPDGGGGAERTQLLLELLGRPDTASPGIAVLGSHGKTSVATMLSCLLGALGLTAGTLTAPHLQDARERIRVATEPISTEDLAVRTTELDPFLEEVDARHDAPLTVDETVAALAVMHFADAPVDVAVLEVLAGRATAASVARAETAVLTPLSGPGEAEVAEEARRWTALVGDGAVLVSAAQHPAATPVVEALAAQRGAHLVVVGAGEAAEAEIGEPGTPGTAAGVRRRALAVGGQQLDLGGVTGEVGEVYLPLHGAHQARNAATALVALEGFLGFAGGLDAEVLREGFAAVRLPGRLEVVRRPDDASVLLDLAADGVAGRALAEALTEEFAARHRVLVLGATDEGDAAGLLAALDETVDHLVLCPPDSPRAVDVDALAAEATRPGGPRPELASDLPAALERASGIASEEDVVVVAGSAAIVGEARTALGLPVA
ncbi:MAG: bifunctional folylpolyglutamate synthase/dihydrofolate synthase [Actinomycetota bacterium]